MLIDVGRVIADRYELVRLLGRGSAGEVWSACHKALGEPVAIKVLTPRSAQPGGGVQPDEDGEDASVAVARFRFEAQTAARLSRKTRHIVRVMDYGEEDKLAYLVMELLEGKTLDLTLGHDREKDPRPDLGHDATLSPALAVQIVSQIARALGQAHGEAVAHRDLKPANVFLTRDEDGQTLVKVLDFGIARAIHGRRGPGGFATAKGLVFGTPGYMSPEQACASPRLDHRCDLWALATIAYEMLTRRLPIDGQDAEELMRNLCAGRIIPIHVRRPGLSDALGAFFDKAFAERIDDRFESAPALAQAFERVCVVNSPGASLEARIMPDTGTVAADRRVGHGVDPDPPVLAIRPRSRVRIALVAGAALLFALPALGGLLRSLANSAPITESTSASVPAAAQEPVPTPAPDPTPTPVAAPDPTHAPLAAPDPAIDPTPTPVAAPELASAPTPDPSPAPDPTPTPHRAPRPISALAVTTHPAHVAPNARPTPVDKNDVF